MHTVYARNLQPVAFVVAVYQPNALVSHLLRLTVLSLKLLSPQNTCIWVVDLDSPPHPDIAAPEEFEFANFIVSDDEPLLLTDEDRVNKKRGIKPPRHGSVANALTLDLARQVFKEINYSPQYFMSLQPDTMATAPHWFDCLMQKFDDRTAAVGVRGQLCFNRTRPILHSLGCLWRYPIFESLGLSFTTAFPDYDVGEKAICDAVDAGYKIAALPNTYSDPFLLERVAEPFRSVYSDRTLDDHGNVIFMHLGRGVEKSVSGRTPSGKTSPEEWLIFGKTLLEKYF